VPDRPADSRITYDGGYADHMIAPAAALALTPAELSPTDIGPLIAPA